MSSNYAQITTDNIRRRGTDFDDIGNFIARELYSDQTHFIYELLQNAEDALRRRSRHHPKSKLPRSVTFHLYHDRLEVSHFGQSFDEDDVLGVSDILKGTKHEDTSQIGTFGIGFKSVYAFTATPEIHSGDEHFHIERYIRPTAVHSHKLKEGETLFVFPFNHESVSATEAFQRIGDRLRVLGATTLLFLRNIDTIQWIIEGQDSGTYIRDEKSGSFARTVTLLGETVQNQEEQKWMVFQRDIPFPDGSGTGYVEIAFRLSKGAHRKTIFVPNPESNLVVYFPTQKVTHLGFLLQGPFITTPARDNIVQDDKWNNTLIQEAAFLLARVLLFVKEKGYLTVNFLEALPIKPEHFPQDSLFRPLYDAVSDRLMNDPLLPTHIGEYVAAKDARFTDSPALRDLFSPEQLQQFQKSKAPIHWIAGDVTQQYTDLRNYIQRELNVPELRADAICRNLEVSFLEQQTDEWMVEFYKFLGTQPALWRGSSTPSQPRPLRSKPFIRLENNSHVTLFDSAGKHTAYLPPDGHTDFPCIKRSLVQLPEVRQFFRDLGLLEPDLAEQAIRGMLSICNQESFSIDDYTSAIVTIDRALRECSVARNKEILNALKAHPTVRTEIMDDRSQYRWSAPCDAYAHTPAVLEWFEGNKDYGIVASFLLNIPEWEGIQESLGIAKEARLSCSKPGDDGYIVVQASHGCHARGLEGFDPDADIDGLDYLVKHPTPEKSLALWKRLLDIPELIYGNAESSTYADYRNATTTRKLSFIGQYCTFFHWLPNMQGGYVKPCDIQLCDLPDEFEKDTDHAVILADRLGMKGSQLQSLVGDFSQKSHIPEDDLSAFVEVYQQNPETARRWIIAQQKPAFPVARPANVERRTQRVIDDALHAPPVTFDIVDRRIRTSNGDVIKEARVNLRNLYTNDDDIMVCQICKDSMPFQLDNGEYYFEVVQCIRNLCQEYPPNYLALCPTCAAKYHHANETTKNCTDFNDLIIAIMSIDRDDGELAVPLRMAGSEMTIQFVETHLHDLQLTLDSALSLT